MNPYKINTIEELLAGNSYVGRGIIVGKTVSTNNAVIAYFIMGRSDNSRNRIFHIQDAEVYTKPFDEEKVEDPRLIIYPAVKNLDNKIIVTNGDHTETIWNGIKTGKSFEESLETREFEPDAPNLTPRISAIVNLGDGIFDYKMSILKSEDEKGTECARYTFAYKPLPGLGHFIHTYQKDGNPLPTYVGEPDRVAIPDDIDVFTNTIWENLDDDNRISLYVRYICLESGVFKDRVINDLAR